MVHLRKARKDVRRRDHVCCGRLIGLTRKPAVFVQWPSSNAPSANAFKIGNGRERYGRRRYDHGVQSPDRNHPDAALGRRHFDPPLVGNSTICGCLGHCAASWGVIYTGEGPPGSFSV
jgi:hypothetical protein